MEHVKPHNGTLHEATTGNEVTPNTPVYAKYGEAALGGFQVVPDLLLKNQAQLKLSPTDMIVLLNVLMHWWYPDQKPFPRSRSISKRIGVSPRTVQRAIQHLEDQRLLIRQEAENGKVYLDPKPLVDRLCEIAPTDTDYLYRKGLQKTA